MLQNFDFRVSIKHSNDPLGAKIKQARLDRVTYIGIIGDNEIKDNAIMFRKADKDEKLNIKLDEVINFFTKIKNSR